MANPVRQYTIYGVISSPSFQKCSEAAAYLSLNYADVYAISVCQEVPRDFYDRRGQWIASGALREEYADADVVVASEGGQSLILGEVFLKQMELETKFRMVAVAPDSPDSYERHAEVSWRTFLRHRGNTYCWMAVRIGDLDVGQILFELYSKVAPITSNNFAEMCRGTDIVSKTGGASEAVPIGYKGTSFFRTLKDAWVMGGDVSPGHTGNSGYSCYGRYFADETYCIEHDTAGVLGMCNDGANTNASSFYITRKRMPWMNEKYVAFGRVIDGMGVVDAIHNVPVRHNQSPCTPIVIVDCGVLDVVE